MYKNVGKKIQILGQVIGWLLLIAGLITWYICICTNTYSPDDLLGWVAFAVGIVGFESTWFMYAFGQLVDDVHAIRAKMEA